MQPNEDLAQDMDTPLGSPRRWACVATPPWTRTERPSPGSDPSTPSTASSPSAWVTVTPSTSEPASASTALVKTLLAADNGDDMIWNPPPASRGTRQRLPDSTGSVFRNQQYADDNDTRVPAYDRGQYLYKFDRSGPTTTARPCADAPGSVAFRQPRLRDAPHRSSPPRPASDSGSPRVPPLRPDRSDVDETEGTPNNNNPLYRFSTADVATVVGDTPR